MRLLPADRFEIRSLKGYRLPARGGYMVLTGYGIWDRGAQGWVSMRADGMPSEWSLKRIAQEVIAQGLYEDYRVYRFTAPSKRR